MRLRYQRVADLSMEEYEFRTRHIHVPLFGVVEVEDKEPFWAAFADPSIAQQVVSIDDDAMDIIAADLELDAEGIAYDASRYVRGEYRPKARGFQGGRLGDFGEMVSFLINRAIPGREVVRVVSWRANGLPVKGNVFPQPDFLVREGEQTGALEVKSTEALDFQALLRVNRWMWLGPCAGVGRCREEALRQLGYVDGQAAQQHHALVVRDGKVVPFPADFGVASAVLVRDGRLDGLRSDDRYKTPKACRESATPRTCWTCLGTGDGPHHVVIAEMRNAPNRLPLVPPGERSRAWLSAYRAWTHAMWARAPHAAHHATPPLVRATVEWLEGAHLKERDRSTLLAFWGSYLRDVAADRGLAVPDDLIRLPNLAEAAPHLTWEPLGLQEPQVAETTREQLFQVWPRIAETRETAAFSFREVGMPDAADTFTVRADASGWALTCLSGEWWSGRSLEDEEAARVSARLVATALVLGRWAPPEYVEAPWTRPPEGPPFPEDLQRSIPIPLRRVRVALGESKLHVGWVVKSSPRDPAAWPGRPFPGPPWWLWGDAMSRTPRVGPLWLALLAMGDRRVRLVVLPDGRGLLRVPYLPGTWR